MNPPLMCSIGGLRRLYVVALLCALVLSSQVRARQLPSALPLNLRRCSLGLRGGRFRGLCEPSLMQPKHTSPGQGQEAPSKPFARPECGGRAAGASHGLFWATAEGSSSSLGPGSAQQSLAELQVDAWYGDDCDRAWGAFMCRIQGMRHAPMHAARSMRRVVMHAAEVS